MVMITGFNRHHIVSELFHSFQRLIDLAFIDGDLRLHLWIYHLDNHVLLLYQTKIKGHCSARSCFFLKKRQQQILVAWWPWIWIFMPRQIKYSPHIMAMFCCCCCWFAFEFCRAKFKQQQRQHIDKQTNKHRALTTLLASANVPCSCLSDLIFFTYLFDFWNIFLLWLKLWLYTVIGCVQVCAV